MVNRIWLPDETNIPADNEQKIAAEIFRKYGKIVIEAPPGSGKTFLGIYLALCANCLGWTSNESQSLFLTFSRNARVQIEQELKKFNQSKWVTNAEEKSIAIYNFHAFFFKLIKQKCGVWGCFEKLRAASIEEHKEIIESTNAKPANKDIYYLASNVYALERFPIRDLSNNHNNEIDDETKKYLYSAETAQLKSGRPFYDDFAPLFLNLLEVSPELVEWFKYRYPVVIVDEFQDTDIIQQEILKKLNPEHIVILYDRYQMIYEFRGANLKRVNEINDYFCETKQQKIELEQVHRCSNEAGLVNFIHQIRKDDLLGNEVVINSHHSWLDIFAIQQNDFLPETRCLNWLRSNKNVINLNERTAILTRSNFMADFLFEHLRIQSKTNVKFKCRWIGSEDSAEEKVRDLIWQLRKINNDYELRSWIGAFVDLLVPSYYRNKLNVSFSTEFYNDISKLFSKRRNSDLKKIKEYWLPILYLVNKEHYRYLSICISKVLEFSNDLVKKEAYLDPDLVYYTQELIYAVEKFYPSNTEDYWQEFCNFLEDSIIRSSYNKLRSFSSGLYILTIHQSKGREFDHVIIPWLSEVGEPTKSGKRYKFPRKFDYEVYEDRRLLYVAVTRAKRKVTILYPEESPSQFLKKWKLIYTKK